MYCTLRLPTCHLALLSPDSSLVVVSHRLIASKSNQLYGSRLFRLTLALVEAIRKLLAVLVAGMVCQHLLARGALERLEASFALDGLGRGVLFPPTR
jgi:hypothetical protein